MKTSYELIRNQNGLPIKSYIHKIGALKMHWHNNMEILLVLKGSVNIKIGNESGLYKEGDLILINSNAIHSGTRTKEDNNIENMHRDIERIQRIVLYINENMDRDVVFAKLLTYFKNGKKRDVL